MKKNLLLIILILNQNYLICQLPPHIITFFIKSIDDTKKPINKEKVIKSMADTEKVVSSILKPKTKLKLNNGIYATYAGFSALSDLHGQISFSRKTTEDKINILITDSIRPIYINPLKVNTISGFIANPKHNAQMYSLMRKQDPETTLTSWYINQEKAPKDGKINYDTIVLIANPKNVILPTGIVSTIAGENLLLPDIYVTKEIGLALNALSFLKIRQYFAPVKIVYNYKTDLYQQRVGN